MKLISRTQRVSDFTLGDIWETGNAKLDDNKGSTLVHVWTPKGKKLFESIMSVDAFFAKYAPHTIKIGGKQLGRYLMWQLHLHNIVRHVKHLIIHN
jgi:hypothetical protein